MFLLLRIVMEVMNDDDAHRLLGLFEFCHEKRWLDFDTLTMVNSFMQKIKLRIQ